MVREKRGKDELEQRLYKQRRYPEKRKTKVSDQGKAQAIVLFANDSSFFIIGKMITYFIIHTEVTKSKLPIGGHRGSRKKDT